ncbi:hypothetical protein BKA66DRAFT_510200 [Pyrenochaeta sp. MPI-SDFR-AT-0127]|nr:hypothetical protein BKA66DRAFT_510200 [Pyrenochaeta sp. MPI-SDFR-AT-0127]
MAAFSSPMRLIPPLTPRRAPSPTMSPGGRRGRAYGSSEESRLRDLSPETTLRAFTQMPLPFDTRQDEYKIFSCIESLTAAERDLGARVAKAAQRLKTWCTEIEQWGWSGSFEPPSDEYREQRRQSLELRIREHLPNADLSKTLRPLEYWGSLLSDEVEQHDARLDDIEDEMLKLDVEELKEHVLDMHPAGRSRPSSAGLEAARQSYRPMDDFSFLITQTLLSALPHHAQLKDRLGTWTARVSILREAPTYLAELETAQTAMRLAWDAIEPPTDLSDDAFTQWKEAVDTISNVLLTKVGQLGRRLDRMLDTLEGREDCLPDKWIDVFEGTEADFGRWAHDSRRRVIDFDVRRRVDKASDIQGKNVTERLGPHSNSMTLLEQRSAPTTDHLSDIITTTPTVETEQGTTPTNTTNVPTIAKDALGPGISSLDATTPAVEPPLSDEDSVFEEGDTVIHNELDDSLGDITPIEPTLEVFGESRVESVSANAVQSRPRPLTFSGAQTIASTDGQDGTVLEPPQTPRSRRGSGGSLSSEMSFESSSPNFVEESPSVRNATNRGLRAPRPELNAAMAKRRPIKETIDDSIVSTPWPPTRFSQKPASSADDLERKISDILTTIPAHIRLTTGPGADAPEVKSARGITAKGSRGYLRAARSISGLKSPELTLSPAKNDYDPANAASGRKSAAAARGDNDIKLYHLTQPGKEHPIKLFIRRVGENGERVMVRVGGGWADLGEYLRQYAEHHGRRTASDGKFEILGLEVKNPDNSPARPDSATSKRDRRFSSGRPLASPATTPVKSSGLGFPIDEAPPPMPNMTSTPGIAEEASVPSTNSSQRSWQGNEVGLAGPKSKKLDLSGQKLEWIEGMMKQARTVSGSVVTTNYTPFQRDERGESRSESRSDSRTGSRAGARKSDFGDLGKVGGTKRIFMRGGQPSASEH